MQLHKCRDVFTTFPSTVRALRVLVKLICAALHASSRADLCSWLLTCLAKCHVGTQRQYSGSRSASVWVTDTCHSLHSFYIWLYREALFTLSDIRIRCCYHDNHSFIDAIITWISIVGISVFTPMRLHYPHSFIPTVTVNSKTQVKV